MENYLISRAKTATDITEAKAMILTAKTIFPNDFGIQFEAYQLEKSSGNYEEAAKSFSYILMNFQNQPALQNQLWAEIAKFTAALQLPENDGNAEQEFYVKMFQEIPYEVQNKILFLTASSSADNNLDHCKLILLLLKKFPQAIPTHTPRLLETLIQGIATSQNPVPFKEILVQEALPMILSKPPELSNVVAHQILFIIFEYYINRMFVGSEDKQIIINESWRKIFELMDSLGRLLKWESFLPYSRCSKDLYWQRLIQIVSSTPPKPSENKQILFCATSIFIMCLQDYIDNVRKKIGDTEMEFVLVEGIRESAPKKSLSLEPVHISVTPPCNPDTPNCLVVAGHCWQLLHSNEILQMDFTQLIVNISKPLSKWISRFLLDLAVYCGRIEEAVTLMNDLRMSALEKSVRQLSAVLNQGGLTAKAFEHIMACISELPNVPQGAFLPAFIPPGFTNKRHLTLLPLTRRAILQYCCRAISAGLKQRVIADPKCSNLLLGNLLVLTQLDWPQEISTAEMIFDLIRQRRSFSYLLFPSFIVNIDMIEEFMHLWQVEEVKLEFVMPQQSSSRRIGTRGADKGVKEDFKQVIRQQVKNRSNDDIEALLIQFLQQEHHMLTQNVFEK